MSASSKPANNYSKAVEWLLPICEGLVEDRKIKAFHALSFEEVHLELGLRILPRIGGQQNGYEISDDAAMKLFNLTRNNRGAYDLAAKVCSANLMCGEPLPPPMCLFAAEVLSGMAKRPKPRKADKSRAANWYKLTLILRVATDFGLNRTRNDASEALSACDAVCDAFERAGHAVDYYSLKRLCVEARYRELREESAIWYRLVNDIGTDEMARRYPVAAHFKSRVSDKSKNSDTPKSD